MLADIPTGTNLKVGDRNDDVRSLQMMLSTLGIPVAIDGIFGSQTKAAVIEFQRRFGLVADGIAGNNTQAVLYSQYMGKLSTMSVGYNVPAPPPLPEQVQYGMNANYQAIPAIVQNPALLPPPPALSSSVLIANSPWVVTSRPEVFGPLPPPSMVPAATTLAPQELPATVPTQQIQEKLNEAVGAGLVVDGIYGPKTTAAMKDFQSQGGLPVTGKPDAASIAMLNRVSVQTPPIASGGEFLGESLPWAALGIGATILWLWYSKGGRRRQPRANRRIRR